MRTKSRPDGLIPAIGYVRVSTWYEEKISDEIQMASINEATRRRGRVVVAWITDLDASGRNFKRKIMEAIEAVETGALEGAREIWVWKYSRFGRNRHGNHLNIARVEQVGGQLLSATEEVDATTATGRFTRGMLLELAAFESDRIGEAWRETHDYRRTLGLPAQGGERFGYTWRRRLIVDGEVKTPEGYEPQRKTGEALRDVYEAYSKGEGFLPLARWLNEKQLRNPHSLTKGGWSMQSLGQYMDSGFAAGLLHVHRSDVECPARADCPLPREHYGFIPGSQPPLLTDDLWAAYQERREERKRLPPRTRVPVYPFSGLIRCGLCEGSAGSYHGNGRKGYGWRCTRSLNGSGACTGATVTTTAVEAEVMAWLGELERSLDDRMTGRRLHAEAPPVKKTAGPSREAIEANLLKNQQALDNASMQSAMGDIPRDSYLRVRDKLQKQRGELEAQLSGLDKAAVVVPAVAQMHLAIARRLREEWDVLPVATIRDLLSHLMADVKIWPKGYEQRIVVTPRSLSVV